MAMLMNGSVELSAPRTLVWTELNDPERLKACIPGCEELERISDNEFRAIAKMKIGPVSTRFKGRVTLGDFDPPSSYSISGEGEGGIAGFAKGIATVRLHVVLVDLRPLGLTGKAAEAALEYLGLTCNKNGIPFDPEKPAVTSGIRLGSSAGTTRGFGEAEFREIGFLILRTLRALANGSPTEIVEEIDVAQRVRNLCRSFPIYSSMPQH